MILLNIESHSAIGSRIDLHSRSTVIVGVNSDISGMLTLVFPISPAMIVVSWLMLNILPRRGIPEIYRFRKDPGKVIRMI